MILFFWIIFCNVSYLLLFRSGEVLQYFKRRQFHAGETVFLAGSPGISTFSNLYFNIFKFIFQYSKFIFQHSKFIFQYSKFILYEF